jgi:flagellar hook-associated protein 3 FlgL
LRVDPNYINTLSGSLNQSSNLINALSAELASGMSITNLQDDPAGAAQSTLLAGQIEQYDTFVQTSSGEAAMMQVADSTLGDVVTQITQALGLAVEASNGTQNSSDNASVAQSLTGILNEVVSLANTSYQGQFLFSGSQGSVQPFTLDTSTTPITVTYNGDTNVQSIETPSGQKLQTNLPGSSVFGTGTTGVIGAISQLITDVSGGASTASMTTDTSNLKSALDQLSTQRSTLDSSLAQMNSSNTFAQTTASQLEIAQGGLVSANPETVAAQLSSAETQHQALLSVISTLGNQEDLFQMMR